MLRAKGSVNISQVNGIEGFCEGGQVAVMDVGAKIRQSVLERPQGESRTKDRGNNTGLTPTLPPKHCWINQPRRSFGRLSMYHVGNALGEYVAQFVILRYLTVIIGDKEGRKIFG